MDHLDSVKNENILSDDVMEAYVRPILMNRKNELSVLLPQFIRRNGYANVNGSNVTITFYPYYSTLYMWWWLLEKKLQHADLGV